MAALDVDPTDFSFEIKFMMDEYTPSEEEDLDERNYMERNNLLRQITNRGGPFPYVSEKFKANIQKIMSKFDFFNKFLPQPVLDAMALREDEQFQHYALKRITNPSEKYPFIPVSEILKTLRFLYNILWFAKPPLRRFCHGDLSESNIVYNPPYLFIIDYQPGHVREIQEGDDHLIYRDFVDFLFSIETHNKKHDPSYSVIDAINSADLESRPELVNFKNMTMLLPAMPYNCSAGSPLDQDDPTTTQRLKEYFDTILRRGGKSRKRKRKIKRKSFRNK
jgi:hypothetical protein